MRRLLFPALLLMVLALPGASAFAEDWRGVSVTPSKQQPDPQPQPVPPTPAPAPAPPPPAPKPLVVPPPAEREAAPAPLTQVAAPIPSLSRRIYFYDEAIAAPTPVAAPAPVSAPAPVAAPFAAQAVVPVVYTTRWRLVSQRYALVPVPDPAVSLAAAPMQAMQLVTPPPVSPIVTPTPQFVPVAPAKCRGPISRTIEAGAAAVTTWWAR